MNFGEIVEPSTRAFLYDEDEFVPEENIDWLIKPKLPEKVASFLISESNFTNKIIQSVLLDKKAPLAQTANKDLAIYSYGDSKYIALCNLTPNSSIGHITEVLLPWIQAAEKCYSLITLPTASYQNRNMLERPFCMLRMLSTTSDTSLCPRLETPNLITGVGANCLSYCLYSDKECSLFVGYIDYAPIDSVNSQPFVDLLKDIGYDSHGKMFKLVDKLPQNNLYI